MIAYVDGILKRIEENSAVVEAGGIGYRVFTPVREDLLRVGLDNPVCFYTYFSVREDAMQLYGFLKEEELDLFKLLINVKGVGPRFALGILTNLTINDILFAIAQGDHKALTKAPGVGNKTAQQIILDLKDKIKRVTPAEDPMVPTGGPVSAEALGSQVAGDVIQALEALGYSHSEAAEAVRKVPGWAEMASQEQTSQLFRESLKQLTII